MNRSALASSAVVLLLLVACGGSSVPVGTTDATDQKLQTKKDGSATGDGATCSWADTALYDTVKAGTPGVAVPTYKLNDEFKSIDGCNECTCAPKGIMCTIKTCEPKGCSKEAKVCPDGSSVGRSGPSCEFAPCPGGAACTDDAKKCPDGSYVGRTGPSCEFVCPGDGTACPALAKQCPDGSYVGATGPKCEYVCPAATCDTIKASVGKQLQDVIDRNGKCELDTDCVTVALAADCVSQCTRAINKAGQAEYGTAQKTANDGQCKDFTKQGCKVLYPPCVAPQEPKCVDKVCR